MMFNFFEELNLKEIIAIGDNGRMLAAAGKELKSTQDKTSQKRND